MTVGRVFLLLSALALWSCAQPLPLGKATLETPAGSRELDVVAATLDDDTVHLVAMQGCADLLAYRNYPKIECMTSTCAWGRPTGAGHLSGINDTGFAYFSDSGVQAATSDVLLKPDLSTAQEYAGQLTLHVAPDETWRLRFRARRIQMTVPFIGTARAPDGGVINEPLCEADDPLGRLACCNWNTADFNGQATTDGAWPSCALRRCRDGGLPP